jgi:ABC-2 type transport system ATP-binding protein
LSTHILPEVSMLCNRVVIIKKGRVVAEDTPHALTARLQGSERIEVQVQRIPHDLHAIRQIAGVIDVQHDGNDVLHVEVAPEQELRPQLAAAVVAQGWGLLAMHKVTLSLEEIFLELTTQEDDVDESETAPTVPVAEGA